MSESTAATAASSSTPTPTPLLQQIYDIVVKQSGTFQNDALTTISSHLSALTPDHVGLKLPDGLDQQLANLTTEMKSMQVKEKDKKEEKQKALAKVIHYQSVYLGMAFHMGIFLLPKGACIPLHDHPGMTVCTAVLYGSVHLRAYQWVHRPKQSKGRLHGPARLVVDEVVTAPSGAIVVKDDQFDADGKNIQIINSRTSSSSIIECPNIHRLIALTDTAIFDILLPPYSAFAKRPCHNYRIHRISKQSTYDAQPIDEKNVKNICEAARFRTSRSKSLHESQYHSSDESASDEEDPTTHTRKPHPLVYLHQCSEPQSQVIRPSRYMGTKIRLHDAQDRAQEGDSDDDHSVGAADEVMIMDDTDTSQSDVLEEGDEPEDDGRQ